MGARRSAIVDRAVKLVAGGMSKHQAAIKCGIAYSTIHRAIGCTTDRKHSKINTLAITQK